MRPMREIYAGNLQSVMRQSSPLLFCGEISVDLEYEIALTELMKPTK